MNVESLAREALIGLGLDDKQITELAYQRRSYLESEVRDFGPDATTTREWVAHELADPTAVQALRRVQHLITMDVGGRSLR